MLPKIKHPEFTAALPSTGAKVRYRPWTVREEKALLVAKESREDTEVMSAVKQIVQECVTTPNFKVDEATTFDVEYLFVKIRIVSVENTCVINYRDGEDGEVREFVVDLEKVQVLKLEGIKPQAKISNDLAISLRWLPASIWEDTRVMNENPDFNVLAAKSIDKIFEGEQVYSAREASEDELLEFAQNLPAKTGAHISQWLENTPRLDYTIEYENKKGTKRTVRLTTVTDFFSFA